MENLTQKIIKGTKRIPGLELMSIGLLFAACAVAGNYGHSKRLEAEKIMREYKKSEEEEKIYEE